MKARPATIIVRHRKENVAKCSLRGLETRDDVRFVDFPLLADEVSEPGDLSPDFQGRIILTLGAPPLSSADRDTGLVLLDGTWRYADQMTSVLAEPIARAIPRSIPQGFVTAYPRVQTACPDPTSGLASVEALYVAYRLLGRDPAGLLDRYYWADGFLAANGALLES